MHIHLSVPQFMGPWPPSSRAMIDLGACLTVAWTGPWPRIVDGRSPHKCEQAMQSKRIKVAVKAMMPHHRITLAFPSACQRTRSNPLTARGSSSNREYPINRGIGGHSCRPHDTDHRAKLQLLTATPSPLHSKGSSFGKT